VTDRWDQRFLDMALLIARMSKDPSTQVGAVIVGPEGHGVRSTGFNGFPRRILDDHRLEDRETKYKIIVHAETNAILNAAREGVALKGCTLYLVATDATGLIWGGPPCTRCTVEVIQAGITTVVSRPKKAVPSRWHDDIMFAGDLLREADVAYREIWLPADLCSECGNPKHPGECDDIPF